MTVIEPRDPTSTAKLSGVEKVELDPETPEAVEANAQ